MKQHSLGHEGRDALPLFRIWEFLDTSSLLCMAQASSSIREGIVEGEESKALWRYLWLWDTPHRAYRRDGGEIVMEDGKDSDSVKIGGPEKEDGGADLPLADSRLWNGSRNYKTYTALRNLEACTIACIQNSLFRSTGAGTLINFMRHHMGLSNLNAGYNYNPHNVSTVSGTRATIGTSSTSRSDRPGAEWETSLCGLYGATSTYRPPSHFSLDQKRYCYAAMKVFIRLLTSLQALLDYDLQIYTRDEETFDFNTDAETAFAARDVEALKGAVNHLFPPGHVWHDGAPLITAFILPPVPEPGKPFAFNEMEVMAIRKFIVCGLAYVKGVETTHVWDRVLVRYSDTCNSSFAVMQPDGKALTPDDGPEAATQRQEVAFGGRFDQDDDTSTLLSGFHAVGYSKLSIPYQRSFVECTISACAVFVWKAIYGDGAIGGTDRDQADFPPAFFRREFFERNVFADSDNGSDGGGGGGGGSGHSDVQSPVNAIRDHVCSERLEGESGVAIATARTLATTCDLGVILGGRRGTVYKHSKTSAYPAPTDSYATSLSSQSRAIEGAAEIRKKLREKTRLLDVGKILEVVVKVVYGPEPVDPSVAAAIAAAKAKKKKSGGKDKASPSADDNGASTESGETPSFGMTQPPSTDSGYYAICNSLLDNVCSQKQGLPLSLAAFVVAVCGEVGAYVLHDTPAGRVPTYANQNNFRYRPKLLSNCNDSGICMVGAPSHITIGIGKIDNEGEKNKEHGFLMPEASRTTLTHFCDPFEPWSTKTPRQWFQDRLNARGEVLNNLTRSKEHGMPAKHLDMWRRALRNLSSARMKNLGKLYPEALREGWPAARARTKPVIEGGTGTGGGWVHPNKGTPVEAIMPLSRQSRYFSAYIDTVSSLYVNQMQLEILEEWAMLETLRWNFIAMGKATPRPPNEVMQTDFGATPPYDVGMGGTVTSPNMEVIKAWHSLKTPEGCNGSVFTSYMEIAELVMSGGNGGRVHCAAILGLPHAVHDAKYQIEHNIAMMAKIRNHAPIGLAERYLPSSVREYFVKWLTEANMRESELLR